MRKKLNKLLLVTTMVIVICGLTGCGSEKRDKNETRIKENIKPAVAFAIANTANSKGVDVTAPIIQNTMIECAENYGYCFTIRVDGEPELVSTDNLDIDEQYKSAPKERLMRDARIKATNSLNVINEVKAVYPEVDYFESIRCSAAALRSLDDSYTSRSIICCGTGLGTVGYLDFRNNLLSAEPEVIVDMLKEREALPDLTGICVYWIGMGQTAAPQNKMTPKQVKNLENIWNAVIKAAGGELISNDYITVAEKSKKKDELPTVSVVEMSDDKPIKFEPEVFQSEEEWKNTFKEPITLNEGQVKFVKDKDEYLQPDKAVNIIRPISEYLMEHKNINILLAGTTAGDDNNQFSFALSKNRAETVKKTLVSLGVDENRITTVGMGSNNPWHISNAGYEGSAASSNRKVVLIDTSTDLAREIMKQ